MTDKATLISNLYVLFLVSPITGNSCEICSNIRYPEKGKFAFDVRDTVTGAVFTHTVETAEK